MHTHLAHTACHRLTHLQRAKSLTEDEGMLYPHHPSPRLRAPRAAGGFASRQACAARASILACKHSRACRLPIPPHFTLPELPQPWESIVVPVPRLPVASICLVPSICVSLFTACSYLYLSVFVLSCSRAGALSLSRALSAVKSFIRDYADMDGGTSACCFLAHACRLLAPGARRPLPRSRATMARCQIVFILSCPRA